MIKVFDMNIENLKFINFFKIVRPYQWVKNILVFTPMLMSHQLTINNFIISIKAFIIFSLIASTIYIINDIADIKSDKEHPYKKFRPLAAGLISIYQCKILILLLLLFCGLFLTTTNLNFFLLIIAYFLISNFYTFFLKNIDL